MLDCLQKTVEQARLYKGPAIALPQSCGTLQLWCSPRMRPMKAIVLAVSLSLAIAPAIAPAQELTGELAALGITAGMPYAKAKRLLDAAGWRVTPPESAQAALPDFPEIECGQGRDAVCSAGFHKDDQSVAMIIGTTQAGQPYVRGTY